ncbi:PilW family protein [uncultured Deefgea sp.]|uniref:PilW family protein n=1 Tax=uncultured Deefgea sp. TaxID=1304914 RepID=UPI002598532D|nr:prepilin-type N-terminal cleavage/methylation domain-containing protein [uncultured Deefgea sp.]
MILKTKQIGFTLIEIMISLVLGLLITGGAFSYFLSTMKTSKALLSQSKLQQEIRSTASLMQRDLRRAGYTPVGNANEAEVKSIWLGKTDNTLTDNNCVIYRYIDERGNLRNSGFLLHTDKKIYMKTTGLANTCSKDANWSAVTSANNVEVTDFRVEYFPSNRPSILITLSSRLSNDIDVTLPISQRIVLQNAPTLGIAISGS